MKIVYEADMNNWMDMENVDIIRDAYAIKNIRLLSWYDADNRKITLVTSDTPKPRAA